MDGVGKKHTVVTLPTAQLDDLISDDSKGSVSLDTPDGDYHATDDRYEIDVDKEDMVADSVNDVIQNVLHEIEEQMEDEHNTEIKVNQICETAQSDDDNSNQCYEVGVDLKRMCNNEGETVFNRLKKFVEDNNPDDLRRSMQKVVSALVNTDVSAWYSVGSQQTNEASQDEVRPVENLLILRCYKRLKLMENECAEYKKEFEAYNKTNYMFVGKRDLAKDVRNLNIKLSASRDEEERHLEQKQAQFQKIITHHKINHDLLLFELLFYRPDIQISFKKNKLIEVSKMMCDTVNRFTPLIQAYLEDHSWTVNYEDTLNFTVNKGKIILSNTIHTENESNTRLIEHMDALMTYLRRSFRVTALNYTIVEDNKFDFSWILITVGYYA